MVRTRFAPSPTGYLHIGGLRTAAYAYALAKHDHGQFFLRIEDTDQKREVKGATEVIYRLLTLFGLKWDGDPVIQSVRAKSGIYYDAALQLINSGHAFYCQCPARNAKTDGYSTVLRDPCRDQRHSSGAVKLRVPDGEVITYHDFVLKKDVSWDSSKVSDTTLLKSDGLLATYHLAMPVDDHAMGITHVIRAVEWLTSTPIHLLIFRYLGYDIPHIGHPSDILDPEGGKLSKRKGNVSVEDFLNNGYLPEALLNFFILLGWAPKDNRELFTLPEFVEHFDISGFQKSNPILNLQKLDWFNGHYLRQKTDTELAQLVKPFMKIKVPDNLLTQILPLVKDRLTKLTDVNLLLQPFVTTPDLDRSLWTDTAAAEHLSFASTHFNGIQEWTKGNLENNLVDTIKSKGWKVGDFFMSLRIAIFRSRFTPPVTDVMVILGKNESLSRINSAHDSLVAT